MNNFNKSTSKNENRESQKSSPRKRIIGAALALVAVGSFAAGNAKHEIIEGSDDTEVMIDGEISNPTEAVDAAVKQVEGKTGVKSVNRDDVDKAISEGTKLRANGTVHPGDTYSLERYAVADSAFGGPELRIKEDRWENSDDNSSARQAEDAADAVNAITSPEKSEK